MFDRPYLYHLIDHTYIMFDANVYLYVNYLPFLDSEKGPRRPASGGGDGGGGGGGGLRRGLSSRVISERITDRILPKGTIHWMKSLGLGFGLTELRMSHVGPKIKILVASFQVFE